MTKLNLNFLSILFIVFVVLGSSIQARPLNILESTPGIGDKGFLNGLSLGAIKQSGPSPGQGNSYTDSHIFGSNKAGPSPGQGH
ncbi:hypothetical protein M5689_012786 [Euphorbia peplus]|nr:hypothetical protein M5689_012786 [Euphorbia peplus]